MDTISTSDFAKLKELLKRTGEFIAYFEIAETKMMEWRHEIEHNFTQHQQNVAGEIKSIQKVVKEFENIMTEAGAARWRIAAESNLKQGKDHLLELQTLSKSISSELKHAQQNLQAQCESVQKEIEQNTFLACQNIEQSLASFDPHSYQRLAQEGIEKINQSAESAIKKSEKVFSAVPLKTAALSLITAAITSLVIGLYISDELPWEIHKHAMLERNLGKALMNAWPILSQQEREKIIRFEHPNH
jgi:hypothetical protein